MGKTSLKGNWSKKRTTAILSAFGIKIANLTISSLTRYKMLCSHEHRIVTTILTISIKPVDNIIVKFTYANNLSKKIFLKLPLDKRRYTGILNEDLGIKKKGFNYDE